MNTFGKILAICILLMALATAGFMIIDFATRKNWKEYADSLKNELEAATRNKDPIVKANTELNNMIKKSTSDLDTERIKMIEKIKEIEADKIAKDIELEEKSIALKQSELNLKVSQTEADRLKDEVTGLIATLRKREALIVALEEDIKKVKTEATANKNYANTLENRALSLQSEIRRLVTELAKKESSGGTGVGTPTSIVRDPNEPNPPLAKVKGIVARVDLKDRTLVELDLGTDHGVNVANTLEVYRLQPRPEYLGTVRIISSFPHQSVGKLMRPNLPHSPLQVGDIVEGTIGR